MGIKFKIAISAFIDFDSCLTALNHRVIWRLLNVNNDDGGKVYVLFKLRLF